MPVFTVGRSGDQKFEIGQDRQFVHNEHVRITVDEHSDNWYLEDLKGGKGNGVYLRDSAGDFRLVVNCHIKPNDVLRLGPENAKSFTFMAHQLVAPNDYSHEFKYLRAMDKRFKKAEEEHAAVVKKHNLNMIIAPIICVSLVAIVRIFAPIDPMLMLALCGVATALPPGLLRLKYRSDAEQLKRIKETRAKFLLCPKCWRVLSDYDVRNCKCSVCKAM